jgi:hypothetical protein
MHLHCWRDPSTSTGMDPGTGTNRNPIGHFSSSLAKKLGQGLDPSVDIFPLLISLSPILILPRIALGLFGNWKYSNRLLCCFYRCAC